MATELENLVVRLTGDGSLYLKTLRQAEAATASTAQRITRTVGAIATALSGAFSVKSFADFDLAMTEATSIMGVTAEETQRMREQAMALSTRGPQGPAELARSYYYLASAGKDAQQAIALLPALQDFATAGAFSMARATELAADAQSALGLSSKDAATDARNLARVTDVLTKGNVLANTTTEQLSQALTNDAAAAMRSFNKDIEEGVAVLAAYADQGNKGMAAGSDLARVMRLLGTAAVENRAAHKKLGLSVFDSSGQMRNMADIVENLEQILGPMSTEMRTITLDQMGFQAMVQRSLLPLIGTSKRIRDYEAALRKAGGTTKEVAQLQMQAFSNQIKVLYNQITVLMIEIGAKLAPVLLRLVGGFREVLNITRLVIRAAGPLSEWLGEKLAPAGEFCIEVLQEMGNTLRQFVIDNRAVFATIALAVGVLGVATLAYKALAVAVGVTNLLLALTGIKQLVTAVGWAAWTVTVLAVKAVVWLLNIALTTTNALLSAAAFVGAVAVVVALGAAFAVVGAAVYALVKTVGTVLDVLQTIPTTTGPLKAVGDVFGEWGEIIKGVIERAKTDMPGAMELLKAGAALAAEQMKALWPPLWSFIRSGFLALSKLVAAEFENQFNTALKSIVAKFLKLTSFGIFSEDDKKLAKVISAAQEKATKENVEQARKGFAEALGGFDYKETDAIREARKKVEEVRAKLEKDTAAKDAKDKKDKDKKGHGPGPHAEEIKELEKLQGLLTSSAEALAHYREYRDRILAPSLAAAAKGGHVGTEGAGSGAGGLPGAAPPVSPASPTPATTDYGPKIVDALGVGNGYLKDLSEQAKKRPSFAGFTF